MRNVLILYATREGQAAKVARRIGEHIEAAGQSVRVIDAADTSAVRQIDLDAFDLLVFGASMHAGGIESELVRFIDDNAARIVAKRKSFFLVLLSAAVEDEAVRSEWLSDAANKTSEQLPIDFEDMEMIAGALAYSRYPLPVKWLMKRIAKQAGQSTDTSRDYEYTDWKQVALYAERLAGQANSRMMK